MSVEPSKILAEVRVGAPVPVPAAASPKPALQAESVTALTGVAAPVLAAVPVSAPAVEPAPARPARPRKRRKPARARKAPRVDELPASEEAEPAARPPARRARARRTTREPLPLPHARAAKEGEPQIEVRRMHRRDLGRTWEFLKLSFRDVNLATVEYQRPRSKAMFAEIYEDEGIDQLLFEVDGEIVAYAECAHEIAGSDWLNPRYFERRDMRPLFVEEIAVHPDWHGRGVGSFVLEQLHHLAKVRGLTHLVLEVAENNENALGWYRKRGFRKLDAAIFLAHSVEAEPELLPPRPIEMREAKGEGDGEAAAAEPKKRRKRKPAAPRER